MSRATIDWLTGGLDKSDSLPLAQSRFLAGDRSPPSIIVIIFTTVFGDGGKLKPKCLILVDSCQSPRRDLNYHHPVDCWSLNSLHKSWANYGRWTFVLFSRIYIIPLTSPCHINWLTQPTLLESCSPAAPCEFCGSIFHINQVAFSHHNGLKYNPDQLSITVTCIIKRTLESPRVSPTVLGMNG